MSYKDRTIRLPLSVTPKEHREIKKLARQDDRSISSWLYVIVKKAMQEQS